jgi:uncharacterized membrane protein
MHKSGVEAITPAVDDIRPLRRNRSAETNIGPIERCLSLVSGAALLLGGLRRRRLAMMLGGGALLYRGAAGFSPVHYALKAKARSGLQIEESVTIHKPVEEVYPLWRRIENLPRLMSHLESVASTNGRQSHWVARIPAPLRLEWDAELLDEEENRKISWRSLPGSNINHSGSVLFHPVPARNGTEIKVLLSCTPRAGNVRGAVANLMVSLTEHQIREDLRGFKAIAEAGEKPTNAGRAE